MMGISLPGGGLPFLPPTCCSAPHLLYCLVRLLLSPLGGSRVILTPFCRMLTGKSGDGMLVSHRRKSLCTCRGEGGR